MQKKIVTFGEILMRLNPEGYFRFLQSSKFEVSYGGGEANVAVSLANYGMNATFVSKVPEHEIGQCAINELRRYGVDCCPRRKSIRGIFLRKRRFPKGLKSYLRSREFFNIPSRS